MPAYYYYSKNRQISHQQRKKHRREKEKLDAKNKDMQTLLFQNKSIQQHIHNYIYLLRIRNSIHIEIQAEWFFHKR